MEIHRITSEVVDKYYGYLASRNIEEAIKLFSDQLVWRIPGNADVAVWVKDRNNREDVRAFFKELYEHVEGISFKITGKFYDGNEAVVTGHLAVRILSTDKIFESPFTVQITVVDGLITRYLMLEDSFGLVEALKS